MSEQRYGFVVFTGRHKILDYYKPDGQQMATADDEDSARTIVRALNAADNHAQLVAALTDALESLKRLPDIDGAYRQTCIKQAEEVLSRVRE